MVSGDTGGAPAGIGGAVTTSRSGLQLPDLLRPALHRLLAEDGGVLPAGPVIGCLAICHDELHRAGVRAGLDDAAEAMARSRLRQLAVQADDRAGPPDRSVWLRRRRSAPPSDRATERI